MLTIIILNNSNKHRDHEPLGTSIVAIVGAVITFTYTMISIMCIISSSSSSSSSYYW